jgi:SAM-dependent methyltransferase
LSVPLGRWFGVIDTIDQRVLDHAPGPVLDVGCGPGRHVVALAERGVPALGIDVTACVLNVARLRGASVIERSVFERVPAAGRWASVLLLDGNIGIGGDPVALLDRVHRLLRQGGTALVELESPAVRGAPQLVRFEVDGVPGPWFRWSRVTIDDLDTIARASSFAPARTWCDGRRWFAQLRRLEIT